MTTPSAHRRALAGLALTSLTALSSLTGCSSPASSSPPVPGTPATLRVAAEWEPTLGVLVSWPPYLPHGLFVALAEDSHLFVMVPDAEQAADATSWFERWGMAPDRYEFVQVPQGDDAGWPRDYGPVPILGADGEVVFGDARYDQTTPDSGLACDSPLKTPWNGGWGEQFLDYDIVADDSAPTALAAALGFEARPLPFVFTGGNALVDGHGGALSTCILVNENRSNGLDEDDLRARLRDELGVERFHVLPNFEDEGIQHIDCLLKLLDSERLLVARPPADHPLRVRYDGLVDEQLATLRTPSGRPYEILRLDTAPFEGGVAGHLAAYTNSLIVEDVVYVPLFGIAQDETALAQWQAALPGHRIRGFPFVMADEPALPDRARRVYPGRLGWKAFDALHCRTRAVWDPDMLHLGVQHPAHGASDPVVIADIVPYSGASLVADALRLRWREAGGTDWHDTTLERGGDGRFRASLPAGVGHGDIEYHLTATDITGRRETAPRTAPAAWFTWRAEARGAVGPR